MAYRNSYEVNKPLVAAVIFLSGAAFILTGGGGVMAAFMSQNIASVGIMDYILSTSLPGISFWLGVLVWTAILLIVYFGNIRKEITYR